MADPVRVVMVTADGSIDRHADLAHDESIEIVRLVRRVEDLPGTVDEVAPSIVVIDTTFDNGVAFETIEETISRTPRVRLLALTPKPAPHDHVVRALAAGALGFIDVEADGNELAHAIRTVEAARPYIPPETTRSMLADKADNLGLTAAERDTRLRNLVLGLIPLAGGLTAIMSLLWRRYLGQIGVRPVDLAIDPATRLVDAFFALSVLLSILGPLLFIGSWLDLLEDSAERRIGTWLAGHRKTARLLLTIALIVAGVTLAAFAQVVAALFVGPFVGGLLLVRALDLDDDLPSILRITKWQPIRAAGVAIAAVIGLLSLLSIEAMVVGPDLRPDGAHGILAPSVLGFKAQPVLTIDVGGERAPRDMLYLGGNADLYVFVDPCNDDTVELVSVGSSRLVVIDEVRCSG